MPGGEWIGRELGEYFVFERIGAGNMAEVYKALQPSMDRMVGIKLLSPALSHDPQFVARFRREVQIVASLEHPHILPVIDFGECEGTLFLVMRYVNGGTLHDLIHKRGPLAPQQALRYLSEIGEALDYAHGRRVVHRDIKPKNVLLDQQGNPFIGDFGLAKLIETGGITSSGLEMIGTPHYMSPEQARGQIVDGRSDLYSLAVVLFQMLTGRVPYDGDSAVGIVMKHINEPVPEITAAATDLPEALNAVLATAMAKEPAERYATAQALTAAVAEVMGASVLSGPIVPRALASAPRRKVTEWWHARSRHGLTIDRKLVILAHWFGMRLRARVPDSESLAELFLRLFPHPRQRTALLAGGTLLVSVVLVGLLALFGNVGPAAIASPPSPPAATRTAPPVAALVASPGSDNHAATRAATAARAETTAASLPTSTPQARLSPSPSVEAAFSAPKDSMTQVLVPAGKFQFGAGSADPDAVADEKPALEVYLDSFWIDRTEVTVEKFHKFVNAANYTTDAERGCCGGDFAQVGGLVLSPDPVFVASAYWQLPLGAGTWPAAPEHPVVQVSWNDAAAYCAWAGRRLPTEAEWEKAARGTDARLYPWGNGFDGRRVNLCDQNCNAPWHTSDDDSFARTGTVGVFPAGASPYDALDMAGNALEWVNDFYDFRGYFEFPTAAPPGVEAGLSHVLRGGSWLDEPSRLRTTARFSNVADGRNNVTGFRCAASVLP